MRVFIGISLSNENILALTKLQSELISDGRITPANNLHLTLVFIGEVNENEMNLIKQMLDETKVNKFSFEITKLKMMRDMVIGEVKENRDLANLQRNLNLKLDNLGFKVEERKYYPHITLSRKSDLRINQEVSLKEDVNTVKLFLSEFTNNGVVYHSLHSVDLK